MIIYLEMFNDEIIGWGSNLENAPSIEIENDHPFFENPRAYALVDGKLQLKEGE